MQPPDCDHPSLRPPAAASPATVAGRLAVLLEAIKFRHSVFALPFALAGMFAAARGLPAPGVAFWIVAACVGARTAAMAYNRWADREIDARNPRTAGRALPAGRISPGAMLGLTAAGAAVFLVAAAMLNPLCLALSPLVLVVLLGYSHLKRFTEAAHLALGFALGLAPAGAWVAVRGTVLDYPVALTAGVMLWVAGFDVLYACLDAEFDRREGLRSIPARLGPAGALRFARLLHGLAFACLGLFLLEMGFGVWAWLGLAACVVPLVAQHRLVSPHDLSRLGPAFFTANAAVSLLFLAGVACSALIES